MGTSFFRATAMAALLSAGTLAQAAVQVSYQDPQKFSEFDTRAGGYDARRDTWLQALQKYIEARAARVVPADQTLVVTVTDLRRAGRVDPGRFPLAPDLRVVRDIDSPRIDLSFRLVRADGSVVAQGERKLRDLAFLHGLARNTTDPLRYEKSLVDDWLTGEFGGAQNG
jgi:hypothetical protein